MASVPYTGAPSAAPQSVATPTIGIDAVAGAFGAGTASAIQGAGGDLKKIGDEMFQRAVALQQLENDTIAKEADTDYMLRVGEIRAKFQSMEGHNAVQAYPKYIRDLQILRREYRGGLPNDDARRKFDPQSLTVMRQSIANGAGHAATQQRRWTEGAAVARIEAEENNVIHDTSPAAFETGRANVEREVRDLADINGWSDEQTQQAIYKRNSKLLANRIQGMARTEPFKAQEFFEANRTSLDKADLNVVERVVQTNLYNAGSRRISEEVNPPPVEGEEGEPLQERIDRAMERARTLVPDDENFPSYVRDRVITDFNRQKSIKRDFELTNRNTVEGALMGEFGDGKIPTSVEELTASDPAVAQAWQSLGWRTQRSYLRALAKNAEGDVTWTPERLNKYATLKGMAINDPEGFLSTNIADESMPWAARRELINLQGKVRQNPNQSPGIQQALRMTRPIWEPAGIKPTDRDRYNLFVGAMQDALVQFQTQEKRQPRTQDEYNQLVSRVIQQQTAPLISRPEDFPDRLQPMAYGLNWLFGSSERHYERTVPSDVIERFKNDHKRDRGRDPNTDEVRLFERGWRAIEYNRLYAKPKTSP